MLPHLTLLVITDGRFDCLRRTLASARDHLDLRRFGQSIIVNDCPDPRFGHLVDDLTLFGPQHFDLHLRPTPRRRGFAGAIRAGWRAVSRADFVFHLEDDFEFRRDVDLDAMCGVLAAHPHLAQMALRRQPWNEAERAAGGVIEQHPEDYLDATDGTYHWLEHRRFFTTNPSLYPRWVVDRGWPQTEQSEGMFGISLFADPQVACGFWGQRDDPPWVMHIGHERVGTGY